MIDTSNATVHTIHLTSAQIDAIVEALTAQAQRQREVGPTPELNALIDKLDAEINDDFAQT